MQTLQQTINIYKYSDIKPNLKDWLLNFDSNFEFSSLENKSQVYTSAEGASLELNIFENSSISKDKIKFIVIQAKQILEDINEAEVVCLFDTYVGLTKICSNGTFLISNLDNGWSGDDIILTNLVIATDKKANLNIIIGGTL